MQISFLADYPQFIQVLAPWVFNHWQPILGEVSVDDRVARFRSHLNKYRLPVALVAHDGNQVYGTASLREHDLPGREDLSPWLGGVFVGESYRGKGIGLKLCLAVEARAATMFAGEDLFLFTLDRQKWYARQGWIFYESCNWCGREGVIMRKRIL